MVACSFSSYELEQHGSKLGLPIIFFLPWFWGQKFFMYKHCLSLQVINHVIFGIVSSKNTRRDWKPCEDQQGKYCPKHGHWNAIPIDIFLNWPILKSQHLAKCKNPNIPSQAILRPQKAWRKNTYNVVME
jgi:hypothetical protein